MFVKKVMKFNLSPPPHTNNAQWTLPNSSACVGIWDYWKRLPTSDQSLNI